jgi:hypothetical protein
MMENRVFVASAAGISQGVLTLMGMCHLCCEAQSAVLPGDASSHDAVTLGIPLRGHYGPYPVRADLSTMLTSSPSMSWTPTEAARFLVESNDNG